MAHSSLVGGSNADRILNCPGSYQATRALPPTVDVSSEYALEGTAMHEVMTRLMQHRVVHPFADLYATARTLIGRQFGDREFTEEHYITMIVPAIDQLMKLELEHLAQGSVFDVVAVEASYKFPNIPSAFGTCDLILRSHDTAILVDWKFGQGVGVYATYKDDKGERINPQLMFYLCAALHSARHLFKGIKNIVVAIIQPRTEPALTFTPVSRKEIKWFIEDMENAVMIALDRDPPRTKGEWCRWAPCKINCPKWTAPMLELAATEVLPRTEKVSSSVTPYGLYLNRVKMLVDLVVMMKKEVDEQLHAYLEDGGTVPGWRLKLKSKNRKWVDDRVVSAELVKLGFDFNEIWRRELQTFAATDATAKRLGVTIPDHLRQAPQTNETTVCATDDPAPPVTKPLAIEQFRAALAALSAE